MRIEAPGPDRQRARRRGRAAPARPNYRGCPCRSCRADAARTVATEVRLFPWWMSPSVVLASIDGWRRLSNDRQVVIVLVRIPVRAPVHLDLEARSAHPFRGEVVEVTREK